MDSPPRSVVQTVLMLLALVAVPVLAVTGVPDLTSQSVANHPFGSDAPEFTAANDDLEHLLAPLPHDRPRVSTPDNSLSARTDGMWNDPFASSAASEMDEAFSPFVAVSAQETSSGFASVTAPPFGRTSDAATEHVAAPAVSDSEVHSDSAHGAIGRRRQEAENAAAQPPLSWQVAIDKLNRRGIRRYGLEQNSQAAAARFHFWCLYSRLQEPLVTHRFAAEADEPLLAVAGALEQIDAWLSDR